MALPLPETEVCPNCGDFCDFLNGQTGWCYNCSPKPCARCGGERHSPNKYCITCQRINWIERNADRLEELIASGYTFTQAKAEIAKENRAICVVCSSEIPGKNKSITLFCKKNEECRKTKYRYDWAIRHGKSQEVALMEALREA